MTKSLRIFLGVAGVVFCVALVTSIPARMLDRMGGDAVRLSAASGTLWRGSARQVLVGGLQLGQTSWRTSALPLLMGRLAVNVDTELPGGFARGDVTLALGGRISISDFEAAAPMESLGRTLGFPQASGDAILTLQKAVLADGWPNELVGNLRLGNVPLAVGGVPGDSSINILTEFDVPDANEDGRLPGRISDQGGPLEIDGTIILSPPGNYAIDAFINTRPQAPPELSQGLMLLGPEGPNGSRQFTMSGSL